jgi:hypothetical protein
MNKFENETHTKNNKQPVAFVDIDETICFYDGPRIYKNAIPNKININKINNLYNSGWKIIYWTARGSSDINNKERLKYIKKTTKNQLIEWNAKFHELKIGNEKPFYDLVIDDKSKRIEEL